MNKREINKCIKTLRSFYGSISKIPIEELMQQCSLTKEAAKDALASYEIPTQKTVKTKRKYVRKDETQNKVVSII